MNGIKHAIGFEDLLDDVRPCMRRLFCLWLQLLLQQEVLADAFW
jgi:hypothetical protein